MLETLNLKRLRRIYQDAFSENIFNNDPEVDIYQDVYNHVKGLTVLVRGDLFGKDCGKYSYETPANWWEHLKTERPFLQRLFGKPKMVRTELVLRVLLDPKSKKIPTVNEVVLPKSILPPEPEFEFEDMVFYPTIFINHAAK